MGNLQNDLLYRQQIAFIYLYIIVINHLLLKPQILELPNDIRDFILAVDARRSCAFFILFFFLFFILHVESTIASQVSLTKLVTQNEHLHIVENWTLINPSVRPLENGFSSLYSYPLCAKKMKQIIVFWLDPTARVICSTLIKLGLKCLNIFKGPKRSILLIIRRLAFQDKKEYQ